VPIQRRPTSWRRRSCRSSGSAVPDRPLPESVAAFTAVAQRLS
jgi:hypothetical protein